MVETSFSSKERRSFLGSAEMKHMALLYLVKFYKRSVSLWRANSFYRHKLEVSWSFELSQTAGLWLQSNPSAIGFEGVDKHVLWKTESRSICCKLEPVNTS